jgi:hypothetical protein
MYSMVLDKIRLEKQLEELDERLARLQSRAREARPELRIGYWNQIYQIKKKRRKAGELIDAFAGAPESKRKRLSGDVDQALTDLRTALETAETRFEEKSPSSE